MARRPMTPLQRYEEVAQRYMDNPDRTTPRGGLESLFALEGPEAAGMFANIPSARTSPGGRMASFIEMADAGLPPELLESYAERTIDDSLSVPLEGLYEDEGGFFGGTGNIKTPSGQSFSFGESDLGAMEKARRAIQDAAVPGRFEGVGNLRQREILADEAARIAAMDDDADVFAADSVDEIGALLSQIDAKPKPKPAVDDQMPTPEETLQAATTGGRGTTVEKPGERAAYMKMRESLTKDSKKTNAAEEAFNAAMADVSKPKKGESKADAIARYKKEFQEATGIDASGKIDKSRALMAFGLALMNNKTGGKGFSGALSALSTAGEAAMPYIDKATADAKAAQLAAGQYALQQRRADVDAALAAAKADQDFAREKYLKWYESNLKMKEQDAKATLDANLEVLKAQTTGGDYSKTKDRKFVDGQGSSESWKVPYVYDSKDPNGGFFLKPEAAIRKHIQGRDGVVDARETIEALRKAATEIAEGGGTVEVAYQKLHSLMKAIAPSQYLTGEPTNVEDYNYETKKLLNQYKRFLTQETGNGISNKDVEMWTDDLMGNIGFFTNLDASLNALDGLDQIFAAKQNDFDNALEELLDPSNHQAGTYDKILEKYGTFEDLQGLGSLVFVDGKLVRK